MDHITVEYKGVKADAYFIPTKNGEMKIELVFDREGILSNGRRIVFDSESVTLVDARERAADRVQTIIDTALKRGI